MYGRQPRAALEGQILYPGDGTGNGDGGQPLAVVESMTPDAGDGIGDGDGGQPRAAFVFATCCVPICFD